MPCCQRSKIAWIASTVSRIRVDRTGEVGAVAVLDVGTDLRAEAEEEPTPGESLQVPGGVGEAHRAADERQARRWCEIRGRVADAARVSGTNGSPGPFEGEDAVDAGRRELTGVVGAAAPGLRSRVSSCTVWMDRSSRSQ